MSGLIYEVSLDVDAGIAIEYRAWLHAHVAEIAALPGFTGAQIHEVLDPAPRAGRISLCVHYFLRDQAAFDAYLHTHAPRLRADSVARFGDRFRAQRRVMQPGARWVSGRAGPATTQRD